MPFTRRHFLKGGLASTLSLSMRAAVTGLPASFLLHGTARAVDTAPKLAIISCSNRGESMNANGPGTYGEGVASVIEHPQFDTVGDAISETINGQTYNASDLENSSNIQLGQQTVPAARAYGALPQDFRTGLVWFNHRTMTNAHPEFSSVLQLHGGLRNSQGSGVEMIAAAIAQENAAALGTTLAAPFVLQGANTGGQSDNGIPLNGYSPQAVKNLVLGGDLVPGGAENFGALYDWMIDSIYKDLKTSGTPSQIRFLDEHALSRSQASALGDQLGSLLSDINDDSRESELKTACAIFKLRVSPVVVVNHRYSGDNHGDSALANETQDTLSMISSMNSYWDRVKEYGLENQVCYATMGVFGRTALRNSSGGRDHQGTFTSGIIHGSHLNGGLVGGLESLVRNNRPTTVQASGINSQNGGSANPDIDGDSTLAAYMKTLMSATGVSSARCDVRIPTGKIVESVVNA